MKQMRNEVAKAAPAVTEAPLQTGVQSNTDVLTEMESEAEVDVGFLGELSGTGVAAASPTDGAPADNAPAAPPSGAGSPPAGSNGPPPTGGGGAPSANDGRDDDQKSYAGGASSLGGEVLAEAGFDHGFLGSLVGSGWVDASGSEALGNVLEAEGVTQETKPLSAGPTGTQVDDALADVFGPEVRNLPKIKSDPATAKRYKARAFTEGRQITLGAGVQADLRDPESMAVLGEEVAHALANGGSGETRLDQEGDPGEARAKRSGAMFANYLEGGREVGLGPAWGGLAEIHRSAEEGDDKDESDDRSSDREENEDNDDSDNDSEQDEANEEAEAEAAEAEAAAEEAEAVSEEAAEAANAAEAAAEAVSAAETATEAAPEVCAAPEALEAEAMADLATDLAPEATVEALESVEPVQAAETIEALDPVEAAEALDALDTATTCEVVEAVEPADLADTFSLDLSPVEVDALNTATERGLSLEVAHSPVNGGAAFEIGGVAFSVEDVGRQTEIGFSETVSPTGAIERELSVAPTRFEIDDLATSLDFGELQAHGHMGSYGTGPTHTGSVSHDPVTGEVVAGYDWAGGGYRMEDVGFGIDGPTSSFGFGAGVVDTANSYGGSLGYDPSTGTVSGTGDYATGTTLEDVEVAARGQNAHAALSAGGYSNGNAFSGGLSFGPELGTGQLDAQWGGFQASDVAFDGSLGNHSLSLGAGHIDTTDTFNGSFAVEEGLFNANADLAMGMSARDLSLGYAGEYGSLDATLDEASLRSLAVDNAGLEITEDGVVASADRAAYSTLELGGLDAAAEIGDLGLTAGLDQATFQSLSAENLALATNGLQTELSAEQVQATLLDVDGLGFGLTNELGERLGGASVDAVAELGVEGLQAEVDLWNGTAASRVEDLTATAGGAINVDVLGRELGLNAQAQAVLNAEQELDVREGVFNADASLAGSSVTLGDRTYTAPEWAQVGVDLDFDRNIADSEIGFNVGGHYIDVDEGIESIGRGIGSGVDAVQEGWSRGVSSVRDWWNS